MKNFQSFQQYYLLDVKRLPKNVLENASGEAAWIFRAEQASSGKAVYDIAREIFHDEPESQNSTLFGAIFNWLELKIRKMDPFLWRKLKKNNSGSEFMLLEALKKYERELDLYREELQAESRKRLLHEGKTAGLEEGRAEGIELGRAEGINLGRAEGIDLGRAEGIDLGRAEGIDLGRVVGIETGSMETASEILQCGLEARFGRIPPQMQMKLSTIKNADDLKKLANYLYSARDLNQFEEFLNSLAGGV